MSKFHFETIVFRFELLLNLTQSVLIGSDHLLLLFHISMVHWNLLASSLRCRLVLPGRIPKKTKPSTVGHVDQLESADSTFN